MSGEWMDRPVGSSPTREHHPLCDDDGWDHPGDCVIETEIPGPFDDYDGAGMADADLALDAEHSAAIRNDLTRLVEQIARERRRGNDRDPERTTLAQLPDGTATYVRRDDLDWAPSTGIGVVHRYVGGARFEVWHVTEISVDAIGPCPMDDRTYDRLHRDVRSAHSVILSCDRLLHTRQEPIR